MPLSTATPNKLMNPTEAGTLRYSPVSQSGNDSADQGEGKIQNDQGGMANGIEGCKQQQENQPDRDRHDDFQTRHRALHVLERSAPDQMIARSADAICLVNFGLGFHRRAFDVAA